MKISTLFSAFVAVYGRVSMQTYDTCKIRRWQNFKGIFKRRFFYINFIDFKCSI